MSCRLLTRRHVLSAIYGIIGTTEQVEGLLVEVLLIVQGRSLHRTLHALMDLTFVIVVVKSMDIHRTSSRDILLRVNSLCFLFQFTLG